MERSKKNDDGAMVSTPTRAAPTAATEGSPGEPSYLPVLAAPPLDRNLSTVGIGPVFLTQPPADTLYHSHQAAPASNRSDGGGDNGDDGGNNIATDNNDYSSKRAAITTWEIVGTIKSTPGDFIVREIGGLPRRDIVKRNNIRLFGAVASRQQDGSAPLATDGRDSDAAQGQSAAAASGAAEAEAEAGEATTSSSRAPRVAAITDTQTLPARPAIVAREKADADATHCAHGSVRAESPVVESTADEDAADNDARSNKRSKKNEEADVMNVDMKAAGDNVAMDSMPRHVFVPAWEGDGDGGGGEEAASASAPGTMRAEEAGVKLTYSHKGGDAAPMAEMATKGGIKTGAAAATAAVGETAAAAGGGGGGDALSTSTSTTVGVTPPASSHLSPLEILELILLESGIRADPPFDGEATLEQLRVLHGKGMDAIGKRERSGTLAGELADAQAEVVWLPHISNDIPIVDPDHGIMENGSRGTFHRSLRKVFPLLQSTTLSAKDSAERTGGKSEIDGAVAAAAAADEAAADSQLPNHQEQRWIKVEVNRSFFPLLPMLLHAEEDLLALYIFRNRGCTVTGRSNGSGGGNKDGGRPFDRNIDFPGAAANEPEASLRILPHLDKDHRRDIHKIISSKCRDFETSTRNDVEVTVDRPAKTTQRIVVRWSKQAKRIAARKRKRGDGGTTGSKGVIEKSYIEKQYSTLCVLRKRQTEHLKAINNIVQVLRCRQSDVGLAGIKDMQGITFQFCTLRNVNPRRARGCNKKLISRGMELGNFERADFVLNQGDLIGNQFEIVVRNLRQVKLYPCPDGLKEELIPCAISQVERMVDSVKKYGFINFYGEQRVGSPGDEAAVGVRPFDIGRAMLQSNFAKAIDLLMRGRSKSRAGEFAEKEDIRKARALWKETGGSDPAAVLEAIPRGALDRERTVLKGLKRYGTDDPLSAIRCLHHGVRMFWINAYQSYCWNTMATERIKRFGTQPIVGDLYQEDDGQQREVKVLTNPSEDKVEINQVVLPLPGFGVQYPSNEIGDLYLKMLMDDGIAFNKDAVPEATARGAYRHLVAPAGSLAVEFLERNDDEGCVGNAKFTFDLPSGSYATMLLREVMSTTLGR